MYDGSNYYYNTSRDVLYNKNFSEVDIPDGYEIYKVLNNAVVLTQEALDEYDASVTNYYFLKEGVPVHIGNENNVSFSGQFVIVKGMGTLNADDVLVYPYTVYNASGEVITSSLSGVSLSISLVEDAAIFTLTLSNGVKTYYIVK